MGKFRRHWREGAFWVWWVKYGASRTTRTVGVMLALALALAGGVFGAVELSHTSRVADPGPIATGYSDFPFQTTTVNRVVTVRVKGRLVRRLVRVVVTRTGPTQTQVRTAIVRTPGGTRVVTTRVTRLVPKLVRRTVTVNGKTHVVTTTRLVPTTKVVTSTQTATATATTVQTATVTQVQVQNNTTTETATVTATETATETAPAVTVTQPVTVTVPTTVTVTTAAPPTT